MAGAAEGKNGIVLPHEIARALREAYVTDATGRGYADGLATWARGQFRDVLATGKAETICRHVDALVELIQSLPAEATVERHANRLRVVLERAEAVREGARLSQGSHEPSATVAADETRAIARDQAAMRELDVALVDLPRAAARAGLRATKLTRGRFARLLGELLAAARARAGGVRGAAVELGDFAGLAGRRFAHLFACGLLDGEVPARLPEDPLLGDDERAALNRALGAAVLPLAARAIDQAALSFTLALATAEAAHVSWTRGNEDGAPLLRSPLVDELGPRKERDRARCARSDRRALERRAHRRRAGGARGAGDARRSRLAAVARTMPRRRALLPAIARLDAPRASDGWSIWSRSSGSAIASSSVTSRRTATWARCATEHCWRRWRAAKLPGPA